MKMPEPSEERDEDLQGFENLEGLELPEVKKLIGFLDFLLGIGERTPEELQHAEKIRDILQHLETVREEWEWNLGLNIYDMNLMDGKGKGVYWRRWDVFLERGVLDIEAGTYHTEDDSGYYGSDFRFWKSIDFNKGSVHQDPPQHNLKDFVEDAKNYQSYITPSLNEIEVEVELWRREGYKPTTG